MTPMQKQKFTTAELIKGEVNQSTLKFIASKEIVDRDGDIIRIEGMDLSELQKNPVFLWYHNMETSHTGGLPIGKITNAYKGNSADNVPALYIEVLFNGDEFSQRVKKSYEEGFLNAVSIGFRALDYISINEDGKTSGWDIKTSELFEVSAVPIGANQDALIQRVLELGVENAKLRKSVSDLETGLAEKIMQIAGNIAGSEKANNAVYDKIFSIGKKCSK